VAGQRVSHNPPALGSSPSRPTGNGFLTGSDFPRARRSFRPVRFAVADQGLQRGTLRVGIMQTSAMIGLGKLLGQSHKSHPGIDL
jgi:hypothetical protein